MIDAISKECVCDECGKRHKFVEPVMSGIPLHWALVRGGGVGRLFSILEHYCPECKVHYGFSKSPDEVVK